MLQKGKEVKNMSIIRTAINNARIRAMYGIPVRVNFADVTRFGEHIEAMKETILQYTALGDSASEETTLAVMNNPFWIMYKACEIEGRALNEDDIRRINEGIMIELMMVNNDTYPEGCDSPLGYVATVEESFDNDICEPYDAIRVQINMINTVLPGAVSPETKIHMDISCSAGR